MKPSRMTAFVVGTALLACFDVRAAQATRSPVKIIREEVVNRGKRYIDQVKPFINRVKPHFERLTDHAESFSRFLGFKDERTRLEEAKLRHTNRIARNEESIKHNQESIDFSKEEVQKADRGLEFFQYFDKVQRFGLSKLSDKPEGLVLNKDDVTKDKIMLVGDRVVYLQGGKFMKSAPLAQDKKAQKLLKNTPFFTAGQLTSANLKFAVESWNGEYLLFKAPENNKKPETSEENLNRAVLPERESASAAPSKNNE